MGSQDANAYNSYRMGIGIGIGINHLLWHVLFPQKQDNNEKKK